MNKLKALTCQLVNTKQALDPPLPYVFSLSRARDVKNITSFRDLIMYILSAVSQRTIRGCVGKNRLTQD